MTSTDVRRLKAWLDHGEHAPSKPETSSWENSFDLERKDSTQTYYKKNVQHILTGVRWEKKRKHTHTHTCQLGARDEIRESNKKGQRFKMEEKPDNDISCSYLCSIHCAFRSHKQDWQTFPGKNKVVLWAIWSPSQLRSSAQESSHRQ